MEQIHWEGLCPDLSLSLLTQRTFLWTEAVNLTVRYIQGKQNMVADQLSCHS